MSIELSDEERYMLRNAIITHIDWHFNIARSYKRKGNKDAALNVLKETSKYQELYKKLTV